MGDNSILENFYEALTKGVSEERAKAVVIDRDGQVISRVLDELPFSHALSFRYIGMKLGYDVPESNDVYKVTTNLSKQGLLILHIRDGMCLCYFPDVITQEQYQSMEFELMRGNDYLYQYDPSKEGFLDLDDILEYVRGMVQNNGRKRVKTIK